ncbi:hypothetical protein ASG72_15105 [Bosea sp. Leaf344]|uniref:hypothetical protein n=1 Tax=Bosea sp. Leaf344 TaxID=1736346 RepID=UPI0006F359DB|nr:hypothetical protein [Bosea sp. Leaf344]KQU51111.1 hypothetical protein ASG72_15105 [Bosea sp. Leaf344]
MNTANLQLEGLLVVMAQLVRQVAEAGPGARQAVEKALNAAEATILSDEQRRRQLSDSQMEAMLFPVRYLASTLDSPGGERNFSQTAADIGRSKNGAATRAD